MLKNVISRADLLGLSRRKSRPYDEVSERKTAEPELVAEGWAVARRGKTRVAFRRPKPFGVVLEDRVWTLLWRMGFPQMSGTGGGTLTVNPDSLQTVTSQLDAVAIDDEVGILVECKSQQTLGRRSTMQEDIAKLAVTREAFIRALNKSGGTKRTAILIFWTKNVIVSRNDRERAKNHGVVLLGDEDLDYYEKIVSLLGPAARYQFLAELVPGKAIPGLTAKVPALRTKVGGHTAYAFAISPEYLLKVAYVSHRRRDDAASDVTSYQRIATKSRLLQIAKYLKSDPNAMFPTNIVINLDPGPKRGSAPQFDRATQEEGSQGAVLGWLTLKPAYKSAWIIDGQHRLYAYSFAGEEIAQRSRLSVLAFEGLPGSIQQKLFIEINGEQKRVKRGLLEELYADLHRGADDPRLRTHALISEAIQELDSDPDSPFFDRLLLSGRPSTLTRRISITSMFAALDRPGFYHAAVRDMVVVEPGPFWDKSDAGIVTRTTAVLDAWFGHIRAAVPDWWDLGAADGGGLAMNDGVTISLMVLRSVFQHLDAGTSKLHSHTPKEIIRRLEPLAQTFGEYLAAFGAAERTLFRALRGTQGQTAGMRHAQAYLQTKFPEFRPDGLREYLEREQANTNAQASARITEIERKLQRVVIGLLKENLGLVGDRWWWEGVPKAVRASASKMQDDDHNGRGGLEYYLFLIDYRTIALANWTLLGPLVGYGKTGNKEKKTEWIVKVNDIRKVADHPSSGQYVSFEELSELDQYSAWISTKTQAGDSEGEASIEDEPLVDGA